MSEARDLITEFQQGQYAEQRASGQPLPCVCIMGHQDFEAFCGCLEAMYSLAPTPNAMQAGAMARCKPGVLFFNGVTIYVSYANEKGMVFGGLERG